MTFLLWRHNLIFDVNFDVKKYSFDICPLFTCQVSWQDIYYIYKSYAEIIKICDILMTDFRAVWPGRWFEVGVSLLLAPAGVDKRGLFL